jgi:hypothetical protein
VCALCESMFPVYRRRHLRFCLASHKMCRIHSAIITSAILTAVAMYRAALLFYPLQDGCIARIAARWIQHLSTLKATIVVPVKEVKQHRARFGERTTWCSISVSCTDWIRFRWWTTGKLLQAR